MSLNKVILIGNLGKDAEVRTVGQNQVASFTLATTEKFKNQDGPLGENIECHNCELWGNAGVYQYLKKGTQVYCEGAIKTDTWEKDGQKHSLTKIRVFSIQLLGSKPATEPAKGQTYYTREDGWQ